MSCWKTPARTHPSHEHCVLVVLSVPPNSSPPDPSVCPYRQYLEESNILHREYQVHAEPSLHPGKTYRSKVFCCLQRGLGGWRAEGVIRRSLNRTEPVA